MPDYRRAWHPGGTYFFTVNTLRRRGCTLLTQHIDSLRTAVRAVRRTHSTFQARVGDRIYPAGSNSSPGPVALTDGLRQLHARIGACAQAMAAQS